MKIENSLNFISPERDIEFIEVPGADGEMAIDNGRYKCTEKSFPCKIFPPKGKSLFDISNEINEWLSTDFCWSPLYFTDYPDYYFMAMSYQSRDLQQIISTFGSATLTFKLDPYKYRKDGDVVKTIKNGCFLYNSEAQTAKPIIDIDGSGDILIRITNGETTQTMQLKGVSNGITLDCEAEEAFYITTSMSEKVYSYPFLKLLPGKNVISWTGNVTAFKVTPRWRALV